MKIKNTHIMAAVVALSLVAVSHTAQAAKKKVNKTTDIALTSKGTLQGMVVNRNNRGQANAVVQVINAKGVVTKVKADKRGRFQTKLAKGGSYVLKTKHGAVAVRVWKHKLAPRKANKGILLVSDSKVVRGQHLNGFLHDNLVPIAGLSGFGGVVFADALRKKGS